MNVTLSNKSLFVVFLDKTTFFGDISEEQESHIRGLIGLRFSQAMDEENFDSQLREIVFPKLGETREKQKQVDGLIQGVTINSDFELRDNLLYYKPIPLSIPKVLAEKFRELIETSSEELDKWIRFWCWLSTNESSHSRENIYTYMLEQKIPIVPSGLMLMYRRVLKVQDQGQGNFELYEFLDKTYNKLKTSKKSTNVEVYQDLKTKEYTLKDGEGANQPVGNLKDLFAHQRNSDVAPYTDNYSRTFKISIGKEVSMPRKEVCADVRNKCAPGLHIGGPNFSYNGFGDTPIACLVNPKDVVCIFPNSYGKSRVCAYTPIALLDRDAEWANKAEVENLIGEVCQEQINKLQKEIESTTFVDETPQKIYGEKEVWVQPTLPSYKDILSILKG